MTEPTDVAPFAMYLAPGLRPLSPGELALIKAQTAALLGLRSEQIEPVPIELKAVGEIDDEFSRVPETEQSRQPYLALLTLLRNGAHAVGSLCCMLIYDLSVPFPALDYLKGLAEITQLPVLLGACRQAPGQADRQILVRWLR